MTWTARTWTDRRRAAVRLGRRLSEQLIADQPRRVADRADQVSPGQADAGSRARPAAPALALAHPPGPAPARPPARRRVVAASLRLGDERESETLFAGGRNGSDRGRG